MAADVAVVRDIAACLDPQTDSVAVRRAQFATLQRQCAAAAGTVLPRMAAVMARWEPGLFVGDAAVEAVHAAGGDAAPLPVDNLELERWFRLPKHHARHIHGHAHAGVALVHHGPTRMLVLDAHRLHPEPFRRDQLAPYRGARPPASQVAALARQRTMRAARSPTRRHELLRQLEADYLNSS